MGQNLLNSSAIGTIFALAIIFVYVLKGAKQGFAKTFFSTFGTFISLILAVLLCSSFTKFLESSFGVVTKISNKLATSLSKMIGSKVMDTTLSQAVEDPIVQASLPGWVFKIVLRVVSQGNVNQTTTLNQVITPVFGFYVTNLISIVILTILFKIIFFIICDIINKMHSIVLVGVLDTVLGIVLGFVKAIISLQVVLLVLNVLPFSVTDSFLNMLKASKFVQFIDRINLFDIIFNKLSAKSVIKYITGIIK